MVNNISNKVNVNQTQLKMKLSASVIGGGEELYAKQLVVKILIPVKIEVIFYIISGKCNDNNGVRFTCDCYKGWDGPNCTHKSCNGINTCGSHGKLLY